MIEALALLIGVLAVAAIMLLIIVPEGIHHTRRARAARRRAGGIATVTIFIDPAPFLAAMRQSAEAMEAFARALTPSLSPEEAARVAVFGLDKPEEDTHA